MRYFIFGFMGILLSACSTEDAYYFRTHPSVLQKALERCPGKSPKQLDCQTLEEIAKKMNQLAYQLQLDPQDFGKTVLRTQEKLAQDQVKLAKTPNNTQLNTQIQQEEQDIAEYLAVLKWLESPEK